MTASLRTDYDAFLYSTVGDDANGHPLTLLTVLARLGVDPWEEAADLASLPTEPAMQRLAARLESMPNGPASAADTVNIVSRLIELLHRAAVPVPAAARKDSLLEIPVHVKVVKQAKAINPAVYYLVGILFLLITQWAVTSRHGQPSMDTSISVDPRK
jgi:hypothetical protein